ncbi:hypothetical protein Tco_0418223, partial [Tanacetum coccineum]
LFARSVVSNEKEFVLMPWIEDSVFGNIKIPGQCPKLPEPARLCLMGGGGYNDYLHWSVRGMDRVNLGRCWEGDIRIERKGGRMIVERSGGVSVGCLLVELALVEGRPPGVVVGLGVVGGASGGVWCWGIRIRAGGEGAGWMVIGLESMCGGVERVMNLMHGLSVMKMVIRVGLGQHSARWARQSDHDPEGVVWGGGLECGVSEDNVGILGGFFGRVS